MQLIKELGIALDEEYLASETKKGRTPVILATAEKLLGIVFVADAIKDGATEAIEKLHKMGITVVMLTGDNKNTAEYVAQMV